MTKVSHNKTLNRQTPLPDNRWDAGRPYLGHSASSPLVAVQMKRAGSHQASKMKSQKAPGKKGLYIRELFAASPKKSKTQVPNSCPYKAKQCQKVWKNQKIFMGEEEWKGNGEYTLQREISRESHTRRHLYFQDARPHSPSIPSWRNHYSTIFSSQQNSVP